MYQFVKRRFLCPCMALFLLFSCVLPAFAASGADAVTTKTIRVAYPLQAGLTEIDENGNYIGFTYEYLQEIAQYTGWDYEFVQIPGDINYSLTTLMEMLENGEIDLMGGMLYRDAMADRYDYAGRSYGTVSTVLQVLDEKASTLISSQLRQTLRIAVIENAATQQNELADYCERNMITPELVLCADDKEQVQALQDGRADALLNSSMNLIDGLTSIASFADKPFYFITTKGRDDLVQELNTAIQNIEQTDPLYTATLIDKYFNASATNEILLTEQEKAFIAQSTAIRVGVLKNHAPLAYQDEKTGDFAGISPDLLEYIAKKTGLTFTYVPADSEEALAKMAQAQEIDIISELLYDYTVGRKQNAALSRPYADAQYVMVLGPKVNETDLSDKRLALTKSTFYDGPFVGSVSFYDTLEDCINAVISGKADYTYGNSYSIQYYINRSNSKALRLIPQIYQSYRACFGVVKPAQQELLSILNKCILGIPTTDMQAIVFQNTTYVTSFSLGAFIRDNPIPVIAVSSGILFVIIMLLVFFLRSRIKMNRQTALELKKHLLVYEMSNDVFFEYDYATGNLMTSVPNVKQQGNETENLLIFNKNTDADDTPQQAEARKNFFLLMTSAQDGVHEFQGFTDSGALCWMRMTQKTIYNDLKKPAYCVGKITNIDAERREKEQLEDQAQKDSLTHMLNAATIRERITTQLEKEHSGALLMLDIDRFKTVNDTFGHLLGDHVLVLVAQALKDCFPENSMIGRVGGDEFVIYLNRTDSKDALAAQCQKLCQEIRSLPTGQAGLTLTVSVGAALSDGQKEYGILYREADVALYLAKRNGRDQFHIADAPYTE